MRPKAFFTLKVIALAVVSVLTLVTTVLLFSFVLFSVRASGEMLLLGFGWRDVADGLQDSPMVVPIDPGERRHFDRRAARRARRQG